MLDLGADSAFDSRRLERPTEPSFFSPLLSALRGRLVWSFQLSRISVLTADEVGKNPTDTPGASPT
jgi:hypothetical protein